MVETLSEIEKEILVNASDGYQNPNRYKMDKYSKIMEKIKNNESDFDDSECSLMFEFLAGYVSSNYDANVVSALREKARRYKFPNDPDKLKQ